MYIVDSLNIIHYRVSNYLLLTTTKNFYSFEPAFTNYKISLLSKEKTQCLVEFLVKSKISFKDKILLICEQVHGSNIVIATKDMVIENCQVVKIENPELNKTVEVKYKVFLQTDGILSTDKNCVIIIFTADCVPLFVYDETERLYGLVHVGRLGYENGIIDNLVNAIRKESFSLRGIKFVLGPHICPDCYYVNGNKYPLASFIVKQLMEAGFSVDSIYVTDLCTYHNTEMFFSYRRNKSLYRMISTILPL